MKKIIIPVFLCFFYIKSSCQISQFPYLEGFENITLLHGINVYFMDHWFGNFVDGTRIFIENTNTKNGTQALGLWPVVEEGEDEEEIEIIAQVDLDLTGLENVVSDFWIATEATDAMKHVKLYMMISQDGGITFGPKFLIGSDHRGFTNTNTPYKEFIFALHPNSFNNPLVVLRFLAKAGAKSGYAAKILLDDVLIYAAPEDVFPPIVAEPSVINVNQINIQFSEPLGDSALNPENYAFLNASPAVESVNFITPDLVSLHLSVPVDIGKYYNLLVSNVEDVAGNSMIANTFTIVYNPLKEGLVITEILYDEPPAGQNDYLELIELYNYTDDPIELGGLMIKGGIASGKLPESTVPPKSYWIIVKDAAAFSSFFGISAYQWHGANLSNDEPEAIFLTNTEHHSGVKIDSLTYGIGAPWPSGASGGGYSMELIDPSADNTKPENWQNSSTYFGMYNGSAIYASPGAENSVLGIHNPFLEKQIVMYPNPSRNVLTITSKIELIKVEIYSLLGYKIQIINSDFDVISLRSIAPGIYLLKISSVQGAIVKKMIKT
ncbi:T9SS type A sorting domain-containing protein [Gaetbulibacter sp. M240]|uniref:T9SS type A sorting domain-containing protein n=1 Tax=Gaetbulibacter sp. M240 TaxID=3126511 RepID=UPI00374EEE4C